VLSAFADSYREFRKFLYEPAGKLSAFPMSSLWNGEYQEGETGSLAEFAVADAILEPALRSPSVSRARYARSAWSISCVMGPISASTESGAGWLKANAACCAAGGWAAPV
jgi:hypothetical protein